MAMIRRVTDCTATRSIGDYSDQPTGPRHPVVVEEVNRILDSRARDDLHALLHVAPFYNDRDRSWDSGWSCRDHSVVLAAVLAAHGVKAQLVHGKTAFSQPPRDEGDPSVGHGGGGHTWLRVPGFGTLDISPRLDERPSFHHYWNPLPVRTGLIGTEWRVDGYSSLVVFVDNAAHYQQLSSAGVVGEVAAVYWPQKIVDFSFEMLTDPYLAIRSPLTDQFVPIAGRTGYVKLATHLYGLLRGDRRPLAGISQRKAWRYLSEVDSVLAQDFQQAVTRTIQQDLGELITE
ncbi:hypothetical protein [Mycobacterium sp. C31M]